jgi:hypothetical protein
VYLLEKSAATPPTLVLQLFLASYARSIFQLKEKHEGKHEGKVMKSKACTSNTLNSG